MCFHCKQVWQVPTGQLLAAKLKYGLGFKEHTFVCPNCDAKNIVTEQEYDTSDDQIPVTGLETDLAASTGHHPPRAENDGAPAPINPVPAPDPSPRQVRGAGTSSFAPSRAKLEI